MSFRGERHPTPGKQIARRADLAAGKNKSPHKDSSKRSGALLLEGHAGMVCWIYGQTPTSPLIVMEQLQHISKYLTLVLRFSVKKSNFSDAIINFYTDA